MQPVIADILQGLARRDPFPAILREIAPWDARVSLSGLAPAARALYLVLLWRNAGRPLLVLTDGNREAEELGELIDTFFDLLIPPEEPQRPQILPALDVLPHQRLSPHSAISEQRAVGLWRLATGRAAITIAPVPCALLRLESPDFYEQLALQLKAGDEVALEDIVAHLQQAGYERREPVEMVGEFSVRGGILDVFPAEAARPVRIELFGDSIESMRRFDVESQRSLAPVDQVTLLPLVETPRSPSLLRKVAEVAPDGTAPVPGEVFAGWEFLVAKVKPRRHSLASMFDRTRPVVVWDEPEALRGAAERLWKRLDQEGRGYLAEDHFLRWQELETQLAPFPALHLRELELAGEAGSARHFHISTRPAVAFHGTLRLAVQEARTLAAAGHRVLFFGPSIGELERLADLFLEYSVPFRWTVEGGDAGARQYAERTRLYEDTATIFLVKGNLRRGVVLAEQQLALFGVDDLFDRSDLVAQPKSSKSHLATFAADIADLKSGDFVVHATHGVGRFVGLREMDQGGYKSDFMVLEYAGGSLLYIPLTRLDLIEKFRGAGDAAPALDKLGGATWTRTKQRVKARLRDMADELLKLYASRRMSEGFAFSPDSNWQREFEDAFEYQLTRDQEVAVQDIKRDMEANQPMDRLLCGDVGFGKTEVAMRAAFKALGDGKQVAVLAPTTVLCFQHYETMKRRFAPFPAVVAMLSRFRSSREIKKTLEELAAGKVDIVVGTHRLLSKDVEFADLGLLIIDEEQRFGVAHKERLKQMRRNVDVLTMSATPIPRTLHMSLVGIRDMSVIETPPKDRLAIHTVVAHFDPGLIRTAIEQELTRGGQVYFVHNRIESIFERAALIQQLVPQCRIGVGHGQMGEAELEKVMLGFMNHHFDVFVSTTIVENGLDIPLANTIIIENAERYGLSELYQLRGRVGRSNRRAYAYLLVPPNAELSDLARKRLAALREFSDLGAGFKIAALDLELRGAGNLLGGEQHGQIATVGFDTYVRLLEQTVQELKGEAVPPELHTTLNLGLDMRIPPEYIGDEHQRLRTYKRVAALQDRAGADQLFAELQDRYGNPPPAVQLLLEFALVKSQAERLGIETVDRRQGMAHIKFHPDSRVDPERLMDLVRRTPGAQFTPAGVLRVPLDPAGSPGEMLDRLRQTFEELTARH